jgi:hypothetical protein
VDLHKVSRSALAGVKYLSTVEAKSLPKKAWVRGVAWAPRKIPNMRVIMAHNDFIKPNNSQVRTVFTIINCAGGDLPSDLGYERIEKTHLYADSGNELAWFLGDSGVTSTCSLTLT